MREVSENPRARAIGAALDAMGWRVPDEVCLVLGGDGTMLKAVHLHGPYLRYFGVNCGHLGFLMNDLATEPEVAARDLVDLFESGGLLVRAFPRLSAITETADGEVVEDRAVNDVYLERSTGQSCHLRVLVDGVEVVDRLVCDGIITATPLGSTAYSFSAGGAAAHPLVRGMQLTPICPHSPRLGPLVLPHDAVVRVHVLQPDARPARVVVDGRERPEPALAVEVRASGDAVALCFAPGHDFTATLIRKVVRAKGG